MLAEESAVNDENLAQRQLARHGENASEKETHVNNSSNISCAFFVVSVNSLSLTLISGI
jgi:hypothetical protein